MRPATAEDVAFVYSVWLRSYKHDSPVTRYIRSEVFFDEHQALLDRLLLRSEVRVVVACDAQDKDLLFGFLAYEPGIVHFVYVKKPFRRLGIARTLVQSQRIDLEASQASHLTYNLVDLWNHGVTRIRFNPYVLEDVNER